MWLSSTTPILFHPTKILPQTDLTQLQSRFHGGGRASRPPVARLLHSERVAAFIFPLGGSAPCSASATPPVLVSLTAVSQKLLAQTQPTCAGLRGVAPGSAPLPPPRARKIIVRNRGAPSWRVPTPQAAPLPRYFVGAALPIEHPAVPKFLLFSRGCPPFRFAPLPRLGWSFRYSACGGCPALRVGWVLCGYQGGNSFFWRFLYASGFALAPHKPKNTINKS